jgi:hypothetical protein
MSFEWGILGPDEVVRVRRGRTLQLRASLANFDNLAVPGIGNVWFCKEIYLAALGIMVAEEVNIQNKIRPQKKSTAAKAIEALACWYSLQDEEGRQSPKVYGKIKLARRDEMPTFKKAKQPGYYVSVTMRQATNQPLNAFGLAGQVNSYFDSFTLTPVGKSFVLSNCDKNILNCLINWVNGELINGVQVVNLSENIRPDLNLSKASLSILKKQMKISPGSKERQEVFDYLKTGGTTWDRPDCMGPQHWNNIILGSLLTRARKKAFEILDTIESSMESRKEVLIEAAAKIGRNVTTINDLRSLAGEFLDKYDNDQHQDQEAMAFCEQCAGNDNVDIVRQLLKRDNVCLKLKDDDYLVPGPAFYGSNLINELSGDDDSEEQTKPDENQTVRLPEGISRRFQMAYNLAQELKF